MSTNSLIAIVGIGCRFPGDVYDTESLWRLLAGGRNCWSPVPEDRFHEEAFLHPHPERNGSHNHRGGHFLSGNIASFDAAFFGIPPAEAEAMDPQQRVALETTYDALQNAGISLPEVRGSETAVYMATFTQDYDRNSFKDPEHISRYHLTGNGAAILSNRISYYLDLKGPSMTLDTGCSGSLVALHQACQSLQTLESNMAVVGGVNIILGPDHMIAMSDMHMLNDSGRSYAFDSRGSGYGRGEGCATVVLKRLEDAVAANDPIRAIIRGTAVNHDGKTNGITFPSAAAQQLLQRQLYRRKNLDPAEVAYVEAHGTGTVAGDHAEIEAISNIFSASREDYLHVGSIKSNIGHLEACSGLAGLIKAILVIEKGLIPPNADFKAPKPGLRLDERKIHIPTDVISVGASKRLTVAVNSFGYGGTNAHVILQKHTPSQHDNVCCDPNSRGALKSASNTNCFDLATSSAAPNIFVLSAQSKSSLFAACDGLKKWLSNTPEDSILPSLSYTLCNRRSRFDWRLGLVTTSVAQLSASLNLEAIDKRIQTPGSRTKVAFLFTGQGAQWYAMGRELIHGNFPFRNSLFESQRLLKGFGASWSIVDELLRGESESRINRSELAQPAATAIQIALVDLCTSMGIRPSIVLGHSSGEIAAAYAAGAITQRTALQIAYFRGTAVNTSNAVSASSGAMLAVGLNMHKAEQYTKGKDDVCIACVNGPESVTLSGGLCQIKELEDVLTTEKIFNRRLKVDSAYHSPRMNVATQNYISALHGLEQRDLSPSIHFFSSVTASRKEGGFGKEYWAQNLLGQVKYYQALQEVCNFVSSDTEGSMVFVEIGPHPALAGPTQQTLKHHLPDLNIGLYPSLIRNSRADLAIMNLVAELFACGVDIDFKSLQPLTTQQGIAVVKNLPPYPWDHSQNYWHESRLCRDYLFQKASSDDLLGRRLVSSTSIEPRWAHTISIESLPWLRDHVINGLTVFPGSGYLCMVIEALRELHEAADGRLDFSLKQIAFSKALIVPPSPAAVELQLCLDMSTRKHVLSPGWARFVVTALGQDNEWSEHCTGFIYTDAVKPVHPLLIASGRFASRAGTIWDRDEKGTFIDASQTVTADDLYQQLSSHGNTYGTQFQCTLVVGMKANGQAVSIAKIPDVALKTPVGSERRHLIHPTTLDGIFHACLAIYHSENRLNAVVPSAIDDIYISSDIKNTADTELLVSSELKITAPRIAYGSVNVTLNANDFQAIEPGIMIKGLKLHGLSLPNHKVAEPRRINYRIHWDVDSDMSVPSQIRTSFTRENLIDIGERFQRLNDISRHFMKQTVKYLQQTRMKPPKGYLTSFYNWMETESLSQETKPRFEFELNEPSTRGLMHDLSRLGVEGSILTRILPNLQAILTGEVDPQDILAADELYLQFYSNDSTGRSYENAARYVQKLGFKNPHMRILEVGGGTTSTTQAIIDALVSSETPRWDLYDLANISTDVLERAKRLFKRWGDHICYRTFNIEQEPKLQGYEEFSYDLVIASHISQSTKDISSVVKNIRMLLRPGGRMILIEFTRMQNFYNLIFGIRPDRWIGIDEGRSQSLLLDTQRWENVLRNSSFNGIDMAINDIDGPEYTSTMMITKAAEMSDNTQAPQFEIVTDEFCRQNHLGIPTQLLLDHFSQAHWNTTVKSWSNLRPSEDKISVILEDSASPLLANCNSEVFAKVITLLQNRSKVLWITLGDKNYTDCHKKALLTGFVRSAHAENDFLRFMTLDVQHDMENLGETSPRFLIAITDIIKRSFLSPSILNKDVEREYVYRNGEVLIPRVQAFLNADDWVARATRKNETHSTPFYQPGKTLCLLSDQQNGLQQHLFTEKHLLHDRGDGTFVEIRVEAFTIHEGSRLVAHGLLEASSTLTEFVGTVTATGSDVTIVRTGDRVCAWASCTPANFIRTPANNVCVLPDGVPTTTGASIPIDGATATCCFDHILHLTDNQTVLINAASQSVTSAILIAAKAHKANIIVVTESQEERKALEQQFETPFCSILSRSEGCTDVSIQNVVWGKGVDAVINCSTQDPFHEGSNCLARHGTFIQLVSPLDSEGSGLPMPPLGSNTTYTSLNIFQYYRDSPNQAASLLRRAVSMFANAESVPLLYSECLPVEMIDKAFEKITSSYPVSKVILQANEGSKVQAFDPSQASILRLSEHATYVVAGGLGNIGQQICTLIAERGGKHIIVLSRRSNAPEASQKLQETIGKTAADCKLLAIRCDITDGKNMKEVASQISTMGWPPVKGIVQSTVVLQDRTLENTTLEDFEVSTRSKVGGTINLHQEFAGPQLDFFLILSSAIGVIGSRGQASYAAANTFLDAFAHAHRNEKARYVSLDLGLIEGAEINDSLRVSNLVRQGLTPLRPHELRAIIEYSMSSKTREVDCHQIISGLDATLLSRVDFPNSTTQHPLFCHVRQSLSSENNSEPVLKHFRELVSTSQTLMEIESGTTTIVAQKLDQIVAYRGQAVNVDSSMTELGLDSLVVTEMRNWISSEFDASISTAEILDQQSVRTLVRKIISASNLVRTLDSSEKSTSGSSKIDDSKAQEDSSTNNSPSLPRLPLPSVQDSLQQLFKSREPFMSSAESNRFSHVIADFSREDGVGSRLQQRLKDRLNDSKVDNWQSEPFVKNVWLSRRSPLYLSGWFLGHRVNSESTQSQARRAATLSIAAFAFKERFEKGEIEPDQLYGENLCTETWKWLFNGYREPAHSFDHLRRYPGNNHIAVLRNGHVFRILLDGFEGHGAESISNLETSFETVLQLSESHIASVAVLAAENRDAWAEHRTELISASEENENTFKMIESALLVICLDDDTPRTPTERCNQFFFGDPSNRWSDKTLQFSVCRNGVSALLTQVGAIHALSVRRFNHFLTQAILDDATSNFNHPNESPSALATKNDNDLFVVEEYFFLIDPVMSSQIKPIKQSFAKHVGSIEATHDDIDTFGGDFFRSRNCSPVAGFQTVIQLACLIYYGHQPPTWQPVSLQTFFKGRIDWVPGAPHAVAFCASMFDDTKTRAERRALFFGATHSFMNQMMRTARGHGFKAHLHALLGSVHENEEVPALFHDENWLVTSASGLKVVSVECIDNMMMQETSFYMPEQQCIFVHYEYHATYCHYFVQTWPGLTTKFCKALHQATDIIHDLLRESHSTMK